MGSTEATRRGVGASWRWALLGLAFFLSGAAALVYQVVWQRILTLHTGIGVTSVALIVAGFMAGLGLGSQLGGLLSARLAPRPALRLFALIEVGVGLFGAVSCGLYYEGLGTWASGLYRTTGGMAAAHFLAFLLPTTLMGMSLPILVRATVESPFTAPRVIATLYGANVLGAALGALLAPWVLIRFLGMEGAALVAAGANLFAAASALAVGYRRERAGEAPMLPVAGPRGASAGGATEAGSFGLWLVLYASSGFLALSLEIAWFRLIDVSVKSTAFTFGTVLCVYLLGLGSGSLLIARLAPALRRPREVFLDLQVLLLAYTGLAVAVLARAPVDVPVYRWLFDYWRRDAFFQLGADWDLGALARLYVLVPAGLFGPPTFLMGLSFGALQRAVQDDPVTSGRKVGLLQAANIAGCALGSLATGLLLLDRLGTAGTLRLLIGLGGLLFIGVRGRRSGLRGGALLRAAAVGGVLLALPSNLELWKRLHGVVVDRPPSFVGEDSSAVSVVVPGLENRWRVNVNGLPHSWLPYGGIHTLLGVLPAVIHPAPLDVAVIGLGSGETAWAVGCRPETRSIRVFEIAASQARLLQEASHFAPFPGLLSMLGDPRIDVVAADGRQALLRSEARYDLIQVDAVFCTSAGSGNLYSLEFFELCARRLKPGGIVCSQKCGRRVGLTFAEAFPHALDFGTIMIGSNEPFPDPGSWVARLEQPDVVRHLGTVDGIRTRLLEATPARRNPGARIGLNRDLFMRDEFQTPARSR